MSLNNFATHFVRGLFINVEQTINNSLDFILLPLDLSSLDTNQGQSFFACWHNTTFLEKTNPNEILNNSIVIGMTSSWSFFDKQIEFSNFFANGSFLFLFLAMAFYWIDLAFFDTSKAKNVSTLEYAQTIGNSLVSNLPLEDSSLTNQGYPSEQTRKIYKELAPTGLLTSNNLGKVCLLLANISLILLLCIRWKESGHFPLSNLYESLMFLSLSCTSIHLFLIFKNSPKNLVKQPSGLTMVEQSQKQNLLVTNQFQNNNINNNNLFGFLINPSDKIEKLLGAVLAPLALFLNAFATFSLPKEMQLAGPLVPALQSNWLMMHVTVMIISYAALILGSLLSIVYIILIKVSPNSLTKQKTNNTIANNTINNSGKIATQNQTDNIQKIYTNLDYLSYRIIGIGFPFLTIGILSGAVWANEAWGSYWSWDPKETWALLTWLIFAIYLHTRLTKGWEGEKPAFIAAFGFIVVWVCYLGVNLLGEGLHSYGFFS